MSKDPSTIEDILSPEGLLAKSLPDFEFRHSQLKMALQIQEAIQQNLPAILEAGTGTGKTFGYLVPVILSGKKAVISTGTKNLQEQVYFKDIPLLKRALPDIDIDAMIMKGRSNYLCLRRYHQYFSQPSLFNGVAVEVKKRLDTWLEKTEFADRAELNWLADDEIFWDGISSSSDQCQGGECLFLEQCFLSRLRSKAAKARIIIVNHHLFFADVKVKEGGFGEIIPRFQVVVFDEAHDVEEIATTYFGESLSTSQLTDLAGDWEKALKAKDLQVEHRGRLEKNLNAFRTAIEGLRTFLPQRGSKGRLDPETLFTVCEGPAREIGNCLKYIQRESALLTGQDDHLEVMGEQDGFSFQSVALRAEELNRLLEQILRQKDPNWLNWYEMRKRTLVLHASPLSISGSMKELLYDKVQSVVFTSATLSVNGSFDYIRSRLGFQEHGICGIYPSHFLFKNQTMMYIPEDLPDPNSTDFTPRAAQRIMDILMRTKGRALVLFTSYHNLNAVSEFLEGKVPFTIFRQGDAPRSVLLDEFRKDIHSVLLGTGSFWQGVDVPGEALTCLIVDKLPFDSPGEPLVAARIDAIHNQGGNPFMEYQLPSAVMSLKQGLGRLIRTSTDEGILAVLDNRIVTKKYGQFFLNSMPKIPISHDLSDISRFLE